MLPHIFVFRADETEPEQKGTECKCRVIPDGCFAHDGAGLVDGLCRDSQCQRDVGPDFPGVERAVETAPFHGAAVEIGVDVEGVM